MKLLILCMSCNLPYHNKQENIVKETWGKNILMNKYDNVSLYFYKAGVEEKIEGNYIYVNTGDDWYNTYPKTLRALQLLEENNIEYDFILRTNCSTYVNIDMLFYFIDFIIKKQYTSHIFTGELLRTDLKINNDTIEHVTIGRGNFLLFNKFHIHIILNFKYDDYLITHNTDDRIFGKVFEYNNIIPIKYTAVYENHEYKLRTEPMSCSDMFVSYRYFFNEDRFYYESTGAKKINDFFLNNKVTESDFHKLLLFSHISY